MRYGTAWRFTVLPTSAPSATTEMDLYIESPAGSLNMLVVSAVDRLGSEGPRIFVQPAAATER